MGSGKAGAGTVSATVLGAFLCLGLVLLAIAATIVLSLISVYTPNNSKASEEGEEYRGTSVMFKILYTNTSGDNYTGASVADSTSFSSLASTESLGQDSTNVYGGLLTNGQAYGPDSNINTSRRRRRGTTLALYIVYTFRMFFKNKCLAQSSALYSYYGTSSNACVKKRLQQCNNLFNNSAQTYVNWANSPSFTLQVFDSKLNSWVPLSISQILAVSPTLAASIASGYSQLSGSINQLRSGCQYYGGLSIAAIQQAIAAQSSEVTTTPATTTIAG